MLLGLTIAVYYENHTGHTNTLCDRKANFSINVEASGLENRDYGRTAALTMRHSSIRKSWH
jgi:hypothetical protein